MAKQTAVKADPVIPIPRFTGRFSVYDTDGGGIHIAWIPDAENAETQHIDLPGQIITVIKAVSEGKMKNPMEIMRAVMAAGGTDL